MVRVECLAAKDGQKIGSDLIGFVSIPLSKLSPTLKKDSYPFESNAKGKLTLSISLKESTSSAPNNNALTSSPGFNPAPTIITFSQTVDPSVLAKLTKEEIKRQDVILELINTERSYLADLDLIIRVNIDTIQFLLFFFYNLFYLFF